MFSPVLNSFDSPFDIDFFNLLFVYFRIKLKYSALCELYESVVIIVAVAVIAVIITIIFIIASKVNCFEKKIGNFVIYELISGRVSSQHITGADPGFFLGGVAPLRNDVTDQ